MFSFLVVEQIVAADITPVAAVNCTSVEVTNPFEESTSSVEVTNPFEEST